MRRFGFCGVLVGVVAVFVVVVLLAQGAGRSLIGPGLGALGCVLSGCALIGNALTNRGMVVVDRTVGYRDRNGYRSSSCVSNLRRISAW